MSLQAENMIVQMQMRLEKDIEQISVKKQQLLGQFRDYAYQKFKQLGKSFKINYSLMNGSSDMKYEHLNIGDNINLMIVSFEYNPKNDIVTEHTTKNFKGKKLVADFVENLARPGNSYGGDIKEPHPLSKTSDLDRQKVNQEIEKRVNNILTGILKGDLVFNDEEYKRLAITNIALEQEIERLNTRLQALNIVINENVEIAETSKKM